jgi:hypothetical protein
MEKGNRFNNNGTNDKKNNNYMVIKYKYVLTKHKTVGKINYVNRIKVHHLCRLNENTTSN